MSERQTFTLTVTMEERWIPHFLGMLAFMQWCGSVGASRRVSFYADGDGDFRPQFARDIEVEVAEPVSGGSDQPFWDAG